MIITIISVLITILISFSFGLLTEGLIERIDPQSSKQKFSFPIILLLGQFFTSFILMIIHFFAQIGTSVYLFIFFISLIPLFMQRKRIEKVFTQKSFFIKNQLLIFPLLITIGLILLSHSIDPNYEFDLGLYHLQNINWFQTYAIVPGLGNLHSRFAFNSNWFLLESLFGNRQIFGQPIFPINIIIIFTFISFILEIIDKYGNKFVSGKMALLLLIFSTFTIYGYANSSSNDKPCDIFIWTILILFLLKIEKGTINKWDKYSWIISLFCAFVFTIKVSSAIIFLLLGVHILLAYKQNKKSIHFALLAMCCYFAVWLLRNIIISGTLIFPISFLQLPMLDWSIPKSLSSQMVTVINYWAIKGHSYTDTIASLSFIERFILWQTKRTIFFNIILFGGLIGNLIFVGQDTITLLRKKYNQKSISISHLAIGIYFVTAIIYWYFSAPDPRFAYGPILASGSWVIARILRNRSFSKLLMDGVLLAIIILSIWIAYITIPWQEFSGYIFKPPQVPEQSIKELTLADGNTINIPEDGIQCWDAPLPCTGWVYNGLIMRSEDLSQGYKIQK